MRGLLLTACASVLAACASAEGEPADVPAAVEDVRRDDPLANTALPSDDPWVIYQREQEAFLRSIDRPQPVAKTRRDRRRARRTERKAHAHCRRGEAEAEALIRGDALALLMLGLPADCWFTYRKRAYDELGIGLGCMGCVVDAFTGPYVACFNTVMEREISRRRLDDDLARIRSETCGVR